MCCERGGDVRYERWKGSRWDLGWVGRGGVRDVICDMEGKGRKRHQSAVHLP